jgi:ASC-1-like (ASCH) protein
MSLYIRNERTYNLLKENVKKVEVRLLKGFITTLKPNMKLTIVNKDQLFNKTIKNIIIYNSYYSLIKCEGLKNVLPDYSTITEGIGYLNKFYGNIKEYPIIAIIFL